jgi:hypothetical protein
MVILEVATGQRLSVAIAPVDSKDFKLITKKRYFFDWKRERGIAEIFKLTDSRRDTVYLRISIYYRFPHRMQTPNSLDLRIS